MAREKGGSQAREAVGAREAADDGSGGGADVTEFRSRREGGAAKDGCSGQCKCLRKCRGGDNKSGSKAAAGSAEVQKWRGRAEAGAAASSAHCWKVDHRLLDRAHLGYRSIASRMRHVKEHAVSSQNKEMWCQAIARKGVQVREKVKVQNCRRGPCARARHVCDELDPSVQRLALARCCGHGRALTWENVVLSVFRLTE